MNLKSFVKHCGTQRKAGEILGISQGMVSGYLTGRYEYTPNVAIRFKKRSGDLIQPHELLPDDFPPPNDKN